jgi:hypothetical protein
MNEFTAWMQNNWYSLGNLLIQVGFLAAGLWFARKILKTIRASQEQVGALLKMSLTSASSDRHSSMPAAERSFATASPYWLTPPETSPVETPAPKESGPSRWAVARHRIVVWLQTPMSTGQPTLWRRATKWLQAPAGS